MHDVWADAFVLVPRGLCIIGDFTLAEHSLRYEVYGSILLIN